MFILPPSSPLMAILNPFPSVEIKFVQGTLTSSKITAAVGDAFHPILFSTFPKLRPLVSLGTRMQDL